MNKEEPPVLVLASSFQTTSEQAAIYRLTGDLHPIHIDPVVAEIAGFDRPILHGLCTLGIACREASESLGKHPADISKLSVRLSAPVFPGSEISTYLEHNNDVTFFTAKIGDVSVLKGGKLQFRSKKIQS